MAHRGKHQPLHRGELTVAQGAAAEDARRRLQAHHRPAVPAAAC